MEIVNRLEQLKCDTKTTSKRPFDIARIKAFLSSARNVFWLPGIREQNVTFVLAAVLWEFSQLVLDPSSGRTFFLVWCLTNIVRLFGNLEWQTAGHYGEEVEVICDMCCGGELWGPPDVWTPVMRTLFPAPPEIKFLKVALLCFKKGGEKEQRLNGNQKRTGCNFGKLNCDSEGLLCLSEWAG